MSLKPKYSTIACLLILLSASLSVVSCSLFGLEDSSDRNLYLTLSIETGSGFTKTLGPTGGAKPEECYISDLKVYLVKFDHSEIIRIDGAGARWNPTTNSTDPIAIPGEKEGKYTVYALMNSEGSFSYSDRDENEIKNAVVQLSTASCADLWADNHFAMSNANNSLDNSFGCTAVLKSGDYPKDKPLRISIELDRLACKVVTTQSSTMKCSFEGIKLTGTTHDYTISGASLSGSALINCANTFNLFQRWSKGSSWTSNGTDQGYPELLLNSPSSSKTYDMDDGYYNKWSDFVNPSTYSIYSSVPFTAPDEPMYCLENNSPYYTTDLAGSGFRNDAILPTKMKGRTTGVVFKVRASMSESTGGSDEYRTFYCYKGRYFADSEALLTSYPELGTDSSVTVLRSKGVSVFENGYMYYLYWIKDENYTDGGKHYYSVIRNTIYTLNVTEIQRIGDDIPGGRDYDEDDPIDLRDPSLLATLTVSSWDIKPVDYVL